MKKVLTIFISLVLLYSCDTKFPDFLEKENGVYMKLLSFEEEGLNIKDELYGAISIEIFDAEGLLLYERKKANRSILENNPFEFLIKHLNLGDSSQFIVKTDLIKDLFKPLKLRETESEYLSIFIKLDEVFTQDLDREMLEQYLLKLYLEDSKYMPLSGVYITDVKEGRGRKIEEGDEITIAYTGYFLNGLEFDHIAGKTAFTFRYGAQGQVIKGLEVAIKSMRQGQKSKIIIPSQLAFGEAGSTTLIVPPYTTVLYDLEVIKVN